MKNSIFPFLTPFILIALVTDERAGEQVLAIPGNKHSLIRSNMQNTRLEQTHKHRHTYDLNIRQHRQYLLYK